jgi:uncharacterized protein YhfF
VSERKASWAALETFSFGDGPALADCLARLVLAGVKRATCWAASDGVKTHVGKRMVMLGGTGRPAAVIETTELLMRRFDEVDAAFALDEGEGGRTLAYWRRAHRKYFERQGAFAPNMPLWCERFRLIARLDEQVAAESVCERRGDAKSADGEQT